MYKLKIADVYLLFTACLTLGQIYISTNEAIKKAPFNQELYYFLCRNPLGFLQISGFYIFFIYTVFYQHLSQVYISGIKLYVYLFLYYINFGS
jgi:hypothetical protein